MLMRNVFDCFAMNDFAQKPLTILGFDANLFGKYDSIKVATLPYNSKIPFLNSLLGLERTHTIEFF
jgi:hypothetical protein